MVTKRKVLILLSSPRSGGNWLASMLWGRGYPLAKEYLSKDYRAFEDDFCNDTFAIKLHPSEVRWDSHVMDSIINILGESPVFIYLTSNNRDEQVDSYAGARLTGRWFDGSTRGMVKPTDGDYDFIRKEHEFWNEYLKGKEYYTVVYEDMVSDTNTVLNNIVNYIRSKW